MPAYPTHAFFSHLAVLALADTRHPLAAAAHRHRGLFRIAGIAGCDIQCMPYQVCRNCNSPYRHNQRESRACLFCGEEALEDFTFRVADGRELKRVDVERDYYRHTHLVLGRRPRPYGVAPDVPPGPPEQPFPDQVVRHLANLFRDAEQVAPPGQVSNYFAFVLGWFSHVVSDALFKGVYPESVRVHFFGHQYHMDMLPAAETLTMTDISHDFGVHWPTWHAQLLDDEPDGGALRHLTMGSPPELYDPEHWTEEFGEPDPAIGRVMDAVRPINREWFHRMYLTPDYTAATTALDERKLEERADWTFNGLDLGRLRAYAMGTGWYEAFIKGIDIYLRVVDEATELAGLDAESLPPGVPGIDAPGAIRPRPGAIGWGLWRRIVSEALAANDRPGEWGAAVEIAPETIPALDAMAGERVSFHLPKPATDYQQRLAAMLETAWNLKPRDDAEPAVVIGPPAFNPRAADTLCREDILRMKYGSGLAALTRYDADAATLHLAGLSDFGDRKLIDRLKENGEPG